jgi:hypothetical protein
MPRHERRAAIGPEDHVEVGIDEQLGERRGDGDAVETHPQSRAGWHDVVAEDDGDPGLLRDRAYRLRERHTRF